MIEWLNKLPGVFMLDLDMCAYGKRPADWYPTDGDVRVMGATTLLTNNPYLERLRKRCCDIALHEHKVVLDSVKATDHSPSMKRSVDKSAYCIGFSRAYAHAIRLAWLNKARPDACPAEEPMPVIPFEFLSNKVHATVDEIRKLNKQGMVAFQSCWVAIAMASR